MNLQYFGDNLVINLNKLIMTKCLPYNYGIEHYSTNIESKDLKYIYKIYMGPLIIIFYSRNCMQLKSNAQLLPSGRT